MGGVGRGVGGEGKEGDRFANAWWGVFHRGNADWGEKFWVWRGEDVLVFCRRLLWYNPLCCPQSRRFDEEIDKGIVLTIECAYSYLPHLSCYCKHLQIVVFL